MLSNLIEIFGSVVIKIIGFPTGGIIVTRYFLAPTDFFQVALKVVELMATSTFLGVSGLDLIVNI